jgi:hypothetical protein
MNIGKNESYYSNKGEDDHDSKENREKSDLNKNSKIFISVYFFPF